MLAPVVLSCRTQGLTPLSVRATAANVATGTDAAHFAASASKSAEEIGAPNAGNAGTLKTQAVKAAKRVMCRCSHGMVFMEHLQLRRPSQRQQHVVVPRLIFACQVMLFDKDVDYGESFFIYRYELPMFIAHA
jgi:hypothetical protein